MKNESPQLFPRVLWAQVVIVSCRNNLAWAAGLRGLLRVRLIEKCLNQTVDAGKVRRVSEQIQVAPLWMKMDHVAPNVGREAHGFLWHIVSNWHQLLPFTIFLQGDSDHHLQPPVARTVLSAARTAKREGVSGTNQTTMIYRVFR
jgi:hypothetical protein